MTTLVGIYSSVPQSGKSTVAKAFVDQGFEPLSFATYVKRSLGVVLEGLGVEDWLDYLWGHRKDHLISELGVTGGYLMSSFATTFFRNMIDQDVWLNCLLRDVERRAGEFVVVDDLRFPNEYGIFDYTIRVIRPEAKNPGRVPSSEGQLDDYEFDYTLYNNSTEADLYSLTKLIAQNIIYAKKGL